MAGLVKKQVIIPQMTEAGKAADTGQEDNTKGWADIRKQGGPDRLAKLEKVLFTMGEEGYWWQRKHANDSWICVKGGRVRVNLFWTGQLPLRLQSK